MSLLRRTRTEMAGAWRSLRYDMGRTPAEPPAGGPDMTSTGMGTFGLHIPVEEATRAPAARRPRRALAVTAFGTLTVVGAAGAYLAVVNGLGSLVSESTAAAGTAPPRVTVTTAVGLGSSSPASRAPARAVVPVTDPAAPPVPVPVPTAPPALGDPPPPPPPAAPIRTPVKPASPESHGKPPVPTPTAPTSSPSPTPSPTPSPSDSSQSSSPDPSPSGTAEPSDSASPSRSWDGRRHKRRH